MDATSRAGNERNRRAANPALLVYEGGLQSLEFHPIANAFPLMLWNIKMPRRCCNIPERGP
ncbi:MAG: hypothetical protein M3R38_02950 [Actinomycetota bacterium]|nr:hypothetical protein [Actinomycetota bacterium]